MGRGSGYVKEALDVQKTKQFEHGITVGEVVDTNDPLQMGRLRVLCTALGDSPTMVVANIPWASYASPFAGTNEFGGRGTGDDQTNGPVAYGMWNIPKVTSQVLVACIDGDPNQRVWFAALYRPFLAHTMPHGRYIYDGAGAGKPEGPLSSSEDKINPLYDSQTEAFSGGDAPARESFEFRTRGADGQVSYLNNQFIHDPKGSEISSVADDRNASFTEADGHTIDSNQGYSKSRLEPYLAVEATDGVNWDPQIYSWTTPGFNSISMHDRKDNARIRIRTAAGTQIILDDTNERIYISTSKGKSWIDMDEKGPITVYTSQDFSVRAEGDINFTTDKTFRVLAKEGIHMSSVGELRLTAKTDLHMHSGGNTHIEATEVLNLLAGGEGRLSSNGTLNLLSNQNVLVTGAQIHLNGPPAQSATTAFDSYLTSNVPGHEPHPRTYMSLAADQNTGSVQQPEYPYNNANVGRGSEARGIFFNRNPLWHR